MNIGDIIDWAFTRPGVEKTMNILETVADKAEKCVTFVAGIVAAMVGTILCLLGLVVSAAVIWAVVAWGLVVQYRRTIGLAALVALLGWGIYAVVIPFL